jgi:hypothetical protein
MAQPPDWLFVFCIDEVHSLQPRYQSEFCQYDFSPLETQVYILQ